MFPGAVAPNRMLAWSPDTTSAIRGGYSYLDDTSTGFSLTHSVAAAVHGGRPTLGQQA